MICLLRDLAKNKATHSNNYIQLTTIIVVIVVVVVAVAVAVAVVVLKKSERRSRGPLCPDLA